MEGPSLFLAAEQLKPFINKKISYIAGNTKIGKERLLDKKILDIFSWGKHLIFQFDDFALRIHFMLYGSFEGIIKEKKVTGDYPRKERPIRLQMRFKMGEIDFYSCSLRFIESANVKEQYDYSLDIMSPFWDAKKALKKLQSMPKIQIADLLLDQEIFAGVGNIIKNEVLFLSKILPTTVIEDISLTKLKTIVEKAQEFSLQFYKWRKKFELKKHYQIYRKSLCPKCGGKVTKKWTGFRNRVSFFCPHCQK